MRDAFGGTFMFKLIIIFIVFFVSFATIAVSYAKTFRLKNAVVNILEQNQFDYTPGDDAAWDKVMDKVDDYLTESNYSYGDRVKDVCESQENSNLDKGRVSGNGACILPISYTINGSTYYYYRVTLYMVIRLPLINIDLTIPISGDTEDFNWQTISE